MNENIEYNLRLVYKLLKQMKFKSSEANKYGRIDFDLERSKEVLRNYIRMNSKPAIENIGKLRYQIYDKYGGRTTFDANLYHPKSFIQFLRTQDDSMLKAKEDWIYFDGIYYSKNDFFLFKNKIYDRKEYFLKDDKLFAVAGSIKIGNYRDKEDSFVYCEEECINIDDVRKDIDCRVDEKYVQICPRVEYYCKTNQNVILPFIKYKNKRIFVNPKEALYYGRSINIPPRSAKDFKVDMNFPELKKELKKKNVGGVDDMYFTWTASRGFNSSTIGKIFTKAANDNRDRAGRNVFFLTQLDKVFDFLSKVNDL